MNKFKVGYTAGVFDLFHVGHLNILKRAKEQCEQLIVAVSTDELVMDYKHKKPVIPQEERVAIVEAIQYVDQVVYQINRDKFTAWEKYKFDAMFVGDDWKGDPLFVEVERKFAQVGVRVIYLPYTRGVSSTLVKQRMYR